MCVYRAAVLQAHKSHTVLSVPLWAARCGSEATKGFAPRSPMGSPRVCRGSRHPGAGRQHQSSPDIGRAGCLWKAGLGTTRPFTALAQRCLKPLGKTKLPAPLPSAQPPSSQVAVGSWSGVRCSITPEQFLQPVPAGLWEHPAKSSASGSRQQRAACPARRLRVATLKAANTLLN